MMIRVIYKDQAAGTVKASLLDKLIAADKIVAFFRSDGWVNVKQGPIRKKARMDLDPKRRSGVTEVIDSQSYFG